jgi:hypothetical protein
MPDLEPLTADQPWRGPEPYTEADRTFFHGRRREVEELRLLLQRDTLTLLTGATGTGKTSLVRAGLLPSLDAEWIPVLVSLDWAAASDQRPLSHQLIEAIAAAAKAHGLDGPSTTPGDTLWETFHRTGARWWNARQRVITPLLVLDQFEAVSSATAERHRDRFLEELAQLTANRPPARVGPRLEDGVESEDAFDFGPVPVRVLLVVREESIRRLTILRALFPTLHRSELRLTDFTIDQARDILMRASAQRGLFAEDVIDQFVPRLATGSDPEHPVPPGVLSVRAHELAAERLRRNVAQITADFFAPIASTPAAPPAPPIEVTREQPAYRTPALLAAIAVLLAGVAAVLWQKPPAGSVTDITPIPSPSAEPAPLASTAPLPSVTAVTPIPIFSTPQLATPAPAAAVTTSIIPSTPIPSVEDRDTIAAQNILERERQRDNERRRLEAERARRPTILLASPPPARATPAQKGVGNPGGG